MKTTIDLPDGLAAEARAFAKESGATLRDLVVAGLRHELAARRAGVRVDFAFPTATGSGLVAGLVPADAIERSYGLPEA